MLDDFFFRGEDIARYGAVAALGASTTIGSKIERSAYDLPGGGSLLVGEDSFGAVSVQVTVTPADGVRPTAAWRRHLLAWLTGGRGQLIYKHTPDVYRIASFDEAPTWGTQGWPLGEMRLRMTVQGLAHAVSASRATARTQGGAAQPAVRYDTALPSPVILTVTPVSGTVTAARVTAGGRTLTLDGLSLAAGQTLCYDAGDAHQGRAASLTVDGAPAWAAVTAWQRLRAGSGEAVDVALTGGEADVTLTLRGRWPG